MNAKPSRVTSVRTPGVPTGNDDPQGETDADALAAGAPDLDDGVAKPGMPADLKAYIDQEIAKGVAAGLAAARPPANPTAPEAPLPDAKDIDPSKITRPVLTKQGYVVPHKYGEPAGAAKTE